MKIEVVYFNGFRETVTLQPVEYEEFNRAARLRGYFLGLSGQTIHFKNVDHYHEV